MKSKTKIIGKDKKFDYIIRQGDIATAVTLSQQIPNFIHPPGPEEYRRRLVGKEHLILIAYHQDFPIGFKVGYQQDDYFYSWMGGVLENYRRKGVAKALADHQESWARQRAYPAIIFKTRNQHKNMLIFALQNGFDIIGFTEKPEVSTNRILLRKVL